MSFPFSRLASVLTLALGLASASRVCATPTTTPIETGLNQAWLPGGFGTDLTSTFDEGKWRTVFDRVHDAGGSIVRIWLFEGQPGQGVLWDANDAHKPSGVDPTMLANIRKLARMASDQGVRIYWTARDGNWPTYFDKSKTVDAERLWNIDSDKYGFGTLWDEKVLGPVVDAIAEKPDALYGLDLMNESEGMIAAHSWADGWDGARAYLSREAGFVHGRAPGVKVSASAGWGSASSDILAGHFDGLGLDFLDVHTYSDSGKIPDGMELVAHARSQGVPIIVGEFGQNAKSVDDKLQAKVVRSVLEDAVHEGFQAVLAWQLEDDEKRFTFYNGDTARPAIAAFRQFSQEHAPPAPATAAGAKPSIGITGALGAAGEGQATPSTGTDAKR